MCDTDDEFILRSCGRLLLDQAPAFRFAFDLLDSIIVLAVTQANVEPVTRDPALQRAYATYDQPPPEELRRPISVNAVAQSLGLPFETVRRRVLKLSVLGLLKQTQLGIYTPTRVVSEKQHRAALEAGYERVWALHRALARSDVCGPYRADACWSEADPLRLVARVSTDYLLRLVHGLLKVTGDPIDAAIWLVAFSDAAPPAGGAATKLTVTVAGRRLGLSTETVRRRTVSLVERRLLERGRQGLFVSHETLRSPIVRDLLQRNRQDTRRMFATLAEFGIPQAWKRAGVEPAAA